MARRAGDVCSVGEGNSFLEQTLCTASPPPSSAGSCHWPESFIRPCCFRTGPVQRNAIPCRCPRCFLLLFWRLLSSHGLELATTGRHRSYSSDASGSNQQQRVLRNVSFGGCSAVLRIPFSTSTITLCSLAQATEVRKSKRIIASPAARESKKSCRLWSTASHDCNLLPQYSLLQYSTNCSVCHLSPPFSVSVFGACLLEIARCSGGGRMASHYRLLLTCGRKPRHRSIEDVAFSQIENG